MTIANVGRYGRRLQGARGLGEFDIFDEPSWDTQPFDIGADGSVDGVIFPDDPGGGDVTVLDPMNREHTGAVVSADGTVVTYADGWRQHGDGSWLDPTKTNLILADGTQVDMRNGTLVLPNGTAVVNDTPIIKSDGSGGWSGAEILKAVQQGLPALKRLLSSVTGSTEPATLPTGYRRTSVAGVYQAPDGTLQRYNPSTGAWTPYSSGGLFSVGMTTWLLLGGVAAFMYSRKSR